MTPLGRFPLAAKFGDLNDDLVGSVLTYTEQQLRSQLADRTRVVDDKATADVVLDRYRQECRTGKVMQATAILEMRLSQSASSEILRESKHELLGESIGRADNEKTRMSLDALKPALDKWVALVVDQVAPKP